MPLKNPAGTTTLILEALRQSGQRALLQAGWGGLDFTSLPPTVFPITYAPYDWLFSQVAAVVHHGGSGTTHFGVKAGVPSLVVPFVYDQFYWGNRLATLGVGPAPIPHTALSAERLAMALNQLVSDATMRSNAAMLGEKIRLERGLDKAIEVIEALR
jgi:sterol 3beta-glucosyltransferase